MCVSGHMLKKIKVSQSEIIFLKIVFFITELMLDSFKNAFLHFKSDI